MRTLIQCRQPVICVEARDRVGGRAWTDGETFGVLLDRDCAWLHSSGPADPDHAGLSQSTRSMTKLRRLTPPRSTSWARTSLKPRRWKKP